MLPVNMIPDMSPSGSVTETTNHASASVHFLEYDCSKGSGIQEEKPEKKKKFKTWEEQVKKKLDDNLRRFFGYD